MSYPPMVTINGETMNNDHGDFWNCIRYSEGIDIEFTEDPDVDVHYDCVANVTNRDGSITSLGIEEPYNQPSVFNYNVYVYVICFELTQTVRGRVVDEQGSAFTDVVVIVYVGSYGGLYQTLSVEGRFGPSFVRVGDVSIDVVDVPNGYNCIWDSTQVAQNPNDILVICNVADVNTDGSRTISLIGITEDDLTNEEWLFLISQITGIPVEFLIIDFVETDVGVEISISFRGDYSLPDDLDNQIKDLLYSEYRRLVYILGAVSGDCSILEISMDSGLTDFNGVYAAYGIQGDGSFLYVNRDLDIFSKYNSRWWRASSTSPEQYLLSPASDDNAAYNYPHILRESSEWLGVTGTWGFEAISNGEPSTGAIICLSDVTQFNTYQGTLTNLYRGSVTVTVFTGFGGNSTFVLNSFDNTFEVQVEIGVVPTVELSGIPEGMQCMSFIINDALSIECQDILTTEPIVLMVAGVTESSISAEQYKNWLVGLRSELTFLSQVDLEIQEVQYAGPGGISGIALVISFPTLTSASDTYSLYRGILIDSAFRTSFQNFIRSEASNGELSIPLQASASAFALSSPSISGSQWDGTYIKHGIVHGHSSFVLGDAATLGFVRDLPWAISINSYAEYVAPWVMNGVYFVDPPTDLMNAHTWTIRAQDYTQSTYVSDVTLTPTQFVGFECAVGQYPIPLVKLDCSAASTVENIAISQGSGSTNDALFIPVGSSGVTATFNIVQGDVDVLIYVGSTCIFGPDSSCIAASGSSQAHGVTFYEVANSQRILSSINLASTLILKTRANSDAQILLTISSSASSNCQADSARSCSSCNQYSCPAGLTAFCDGSHAFCS